MELQSTVDFLIPYRLLLYMNEIWRDLFKNTSPQGAKRKDFRLPAIIPMVLYNGQAKWTVPLNFQEMLDGYELFKEHILDFQYILVNVYSYNREELLKLSGILGAVFLLDQAKSFEGIIENLKTLAENIKRLKEEELNLFIAWTKNILSRGLSPEKKTEITAILEKTRFGEVKEMISNVERVIKKSLKDAIKEGMEKGMKQGLEKGIEKGMEQGLEKGMYKRNAEIARQMLLDGEDITKIMKYTGLCQEDIEKMK